VWLLQVGPACQEAWYECTGRSPWPNCKQRGWTEDYGFFSRVTRLEINLNLSFLLFWGLTQYATLNRGPLTNSSSLGLWLLSCDVLNIFYYLLWRSSQWSRKMLVRHMVNNNSRLMDKLLWKWTYERMWSKAIIGDYMGHVFLISSNWFCLLVMWVS
jgi:hypothetical protein